jgi:hypothetical protein
MIKLQNNLESSFICGGMSLFCCTYRKKLARTGIILIEDRPIYEVPVNPRTTPVPNTESSTSEINRIW